MTREEAIEFIAQSVKSDVDMALVADAIKALEQEPKIKVLDRDEASRKLGTVDVYTASAWITLLKDLEYLGLKICEVEE